MSVSSEVGRRIREGMGQATGPFKDAECSGHGHRHKCVDRRLVWVSTRQILAIRGGMIVGIGKAGNPDVMEGVTRGHDRCGKLYRCHCWRGHQIITAGGIDYPHPLSSALNKPMSPIASGVTTIPRRRNWSKRWSTVQMFRMSSTNLNSAGTNATTCTPGKNYMRQMLQACDTLPDQCTVSQAKGNDSISRSASRTGARPEHAA